MSDIKIDGKYVLIKKDNKPILKRELSKSEYQKLFNASKILDSFEYIFFLGNSFEKEKQEFLGYDFSQFNVREIDMFSIMLNSLNAIATNINLWEAYLKRTYNSDTEIFPSNPNDKQKSILGIKDSEYYDKNVEYVVAKALRNMIVHSEKPYSQIWYDDDMHRHFIVYTETLLQGNNLNKAGKTIVGNCGKDYFDVLEVIKHAFEIAEKLNIYIVNVLLQKEWINFSSSRNTVIEHLGTDWQGAYLVEINPKYPESHLLYLSTKSISKHAMDSILLMIARSLCNK